MSNLIAGTIVQTCITTTPLLLAALGESVVQKSGVVNVGLEGMMLAGAFAAVLGTLPIGTLYAGNPYVGMVVGAIVGILFALLFAFFSVKLTANQVVVGVVINLLALGLTGTIYRRAFGATGTFLETKTLPRIEWLGGLNIIPVLALLMVPLVWWFLNRTRRGLELRACGEQPVAAEAAGVNVIRVRTLALLFGGMMAGIAGASLSVGETHTFIENMTAGRGFIALAIVTSGRWSAPGCLIAALVFGFVVQLQAQGQALGLKLPYQLFLMLPYLVTLIVLMGGSKSSKAPVNLGRPYRRA